MSTLVSLLRYTPLYESSGEDSHLPEMAADKIEALEAENERQREALRPFAEYASQEGFDLDFNGIPLPDEEGVGWVYLNLGHFRAARAALAEQEEK